MGRFIIYNNTLLITYSEIIFYNDSLTLLPLIITSAFMYSILDVLSSDASGMTMSRQHELTESQADTEWLSQWPQRICWEHPSQVDTRRVPDSRESYHANVSHQECRATLRRNCRLQLPCLWVFIKQS